MKKYRYEILKIDPSDYNGTEAIGQTNKLWVAKWICFYRSLIWPDYRYMIAKLNADNK